MTYYVLHKHNKDTENQLEWKRKIPSINENRRRQKRGGLKFLHKNSRFKMEKVNSKSKDLLITLCKYKKMYFYLILVYLSVNEHQKNITIYTEINNFIEKTEKCYIVLGDFNGHR